MATFLNFIFGISLIVIWIVSGGFITQTNVFITPLRKYNDDLSRAWTYSFIAAFITWFLIALFLILIALAIFGVVALFGTGVGEAGVAAEGVASTVGENYLQSTVTKIGIPWVGIGFFVLSLVLVGVSGVLSALTAQNIRSSVTYQNEASTNPKLQKAYTNSIIAASLCLGAFGLLLIGIGIYTYLGIRRRHKEKQRLEKLRIEEENKKIEAAEERKEIQSQIISNIAKSGDSSKIINTLVSKASGKILNAGV